MNPGFVPCGVIPRQWATYPYLQVQLLRCGLHGRPEDSFHSARHTRSCPRIIFAYRDFASCVRSGQVQKTLTRRGSISCPASAKATGISPTRRKCCFCAAHIWYSRRRWFSPGGYKHKRVRTGGIAVLDEGARRNTHFSLRAPRREAARHIGTESDGTLLPRERWR